MSQSIQAAGVSVDFGGVTALSDVTLHAEGAGVIGLMGPNGSGKTTLMNVLSGMQRPTTGEVLLSGRPMPTTNPRAFAQAGVARTFQTVRLIRDLSVRDNIAAGLAGGERVSRARRRALVEEAAASLELTSVLNRWPDELPYGIQRRVEVARVVVRDARVLLLDEPSAGMRPDEAEEMGDVILRLAADRLVVLIDHYVDLMIRLCERVVVLHNGVLIADGPARETLRTDVVRDAYFGSSNDEPLSEPMKEQP